MSFELSSAQVEEFFETGFTVVPGAFSAAEIDDMRAAFDRLQETAFALGETRIYNGSQFVVQTVKKGTASVIRRISWCGAAEPVLLDYGRDPRLLKMAGQLLGSDEMVQLINQAHFKLPDDEVAFPWHQDSQHRGYGKPGWTDVNGRGSFVQEAIAIDDITAENGPLKFIPGSCKLGHLGLQDYDTQALAGLFDPETAVPALMAAGSVALFGPYTIHGSEPNRSRHPRRVFINGYAYPGANSRDYPGDGAGRLLKVP